MGRAHSIPDTKLQGLCSLDANSRAYASEFVDQLLANALAIGASDIHLQPTRVGLQIDCRRDGMLQRLGVFPSGAHSDIVTRLKVLAGLLTYRSDAAQEGRISWKSGQHQFRVCTMPTIDGERAVVRLLERTDDRQRPDELGLPTEILDTYRSALACTSGVILIVGPAGSGKTTTAYAGLREIVDFSRGGRCVISLEDPVESTLNGVVQTQVSLSAEWTLNDAFRASLRQDPEVLFLSEIRDAETAHLIFQAGLTGQLVITTMHAGSAVEAVRRLLDMGVHPYQLSSGVRTIIMQRLVRVLCDCAQWTSDRSLPLDEVSRWGSSEREGLLQTRHAVGCPHCSNANAIQSRDGEGNLIDSIWSQSGYHGRTVIAEQLPSIEGSLADAVGQSLGTGGLQLAASALGMIHLRERALELVRQGVTSAAEVWRVLGARSIG